jgi:hypothetical protein
MVRNTYKDKNCDLDMLTKDIESWFRNQAYELQSSQTESSWLIQAQKTDLWRKAVGASRAFNVLIQGQPNDFSVELGTGEWASNLVAVGVGTLLTGGVSLVGSGLAAAWAKKIESDLLAFIDQKVIFGEKRKSDKETTIAKTQDSINSKLIQLKEALDEGLIDEVAYHAKKTEIERQGNIQKEEAELNAKILKLQKALEAGILNKNEFEIKKAELTKQSSNSDSDEKVTQLKMALATGILSQEEFDFKVAQVQKASALAGKVKQLENAKNIGIITDEEFEKKKAELFA